MPVDELRRVQAAEAEAAEAEDFEQAASLSTQSDALQTRLAGLQHDAKAADQAIQSVVRPHTLQSLYSICLVADHGTTG